MFERFETGVSGTPNWMSAFGGRSGAFAPDPRFARDAASVRGSADAEAELRAREEAEAQRALHDAFAAGLAQGRAEAASEAAAERSAYERLRLSVARLDETSRRSLAARLATTVVALCDGVLAPLALDPDMLQRRCEKAAEMLGDAQEKLRLHINPADLASLDPTFVSAWNIVERPDLERGTLRIEGTEADALDGPAEWRLAIEEALAC